MSATRHIPVMMQEVLRVLSPKPGETYIDCTTGGGGHAAAIAPYLAPGGTLILNDADPAFLAEAADRAGQAGGASVRIETIRGNFALLPRVLLQRGVRADVLLCDLGFSSDQMETPERGLSFSRDGPLDMRLDPSLAASAADLVNSLPEHELARIIKEYGEEHHARRIARNLAQARAREPILTTRQLAEAVRAATGKGDGRIDPATRTFQALRIAVNDELGSLEALMDAIAREAQTGDRPRWLAPGARVSFISFHSLEDRIVKQGLQRVVEAGGVGLTEGPLACSEDEAARNPRARSAKVRAARLSP